MQHENTTTDTQTEDELIRELYENIAIEQALKQAKTPAWRKARKAPRQALCGAAELAQGFVYETAPDVVAVRADVAADDWLAVGIDAASNGAWRVLAELAERGAHLGRTFDGLNLLGVACHGFARLHRCGVGGAQAVRNYVEVINVLQGAGCGIAALMKWPEPCVGVLAVEGDLKMIGWDGGWRWWMNPTNNFGNKWGWGLT